VIAIFKQERSAPGLGGFDGLVDGPSVFHVFEEARLQFTGAAFSVRSSAVRHHTVGLDANYLLALKAFLVSTRTRSRGGKKTIRDVRIIAAEFLPPACSCFYVFQGSFKSTQ